MKDKKYGFKLSELDQKIKKAEYGDKVQMLRLKLEKAKKKAVAEADGDEERLKQLREEDDHDE